MAILTNTNGDIQKDALKWNLEKVTKANDLRHQQAKEQLQVSTITNNWYKLKSLNYFTIVFEEMLWLLVTSHDSGKNQDRGRPGNPDPRNRNTKSAPRHETRPHMGRPQRDGEKRSFPRKGNNLDLKTLKKKYSTEVFTN